MRARLNRTLYSPLYGGTFINDFKGTGELANRWFQPLTHVSERDGNDPEHFLFKSRYRNRNTAHERMRDWFEELLREAGLKVDELGRNRVIYSLRHTSLMLRLIHGHNVDLLMLARNAGTGVDQLERFYLSHADPAMKVANLHSMKPQPKIEYVEPPEKPRSAIQLEAALEEPFCEPAE